MSNEEVVKMIREWLIDNIFRNGLIMHHREIRSAYDPDMKPTIDLVNVIAGLYEVLHMVVMDEKYDYMWHWANKCGSDCESFFFCEMMKEKEREKENDKDSEA